MLIDYTLHLSTSLRYQIEIEKIPPNSRSATGHSYSTYPVTDANPKGRAWCCIGGPVGANDNCGGTCIPEWSWQFFKNAHVTTWRRGSTQTVKWNRNQHKFGFARLTLVPRKYRMNKRVHNANVFRYACYDSNIRRCPYPKKCGTGKTEGTTTFKVPAVPDGDYVLGWSWYGSYANQIPGVLRYHFSDYWSCSNIRIAGGNVAPIWGRVAFKPQLVTGMNSGTCKSLGNRLGVCVSEPCRGTYGNRRPSGMSPAGFELRRGKCFK